MKPWKFELRNIYGGNEFLCTCNILLAIHNSLSADGYLGLQYGEVRWSQLKAFVTYEGQG